MSNLSASSAVTSNTSKLTIPLWFFAFIPYKLGEGLLVAMLPLFVVQVTGGNVADVGLVNCLNSLSGVLAFIFWGNLSDSLGRRRPFLLTGFLGFAICMFFIGTVQMVWELLLWSLVVGFLMAAVTPVGSALVLDVMPKEEQPQSFGQFYQISAWSFVASVLVGMVWLALLSEQWGRATAMRSLVLFIGGFAFLSFFLCWLWVDEPETVQPQREFNPQLVGHLAVAIIERRLLFYSSRMLYFVLHLDQVSKLGQQLRSPLGFYYLFSILYFFANSVVFVPLPIFMSDILGASNSLVLFFSLSRSCIEASLYAPMGRFVGQQGSLKLQAQAIAIRVGIFVVFAILNWHWIKSTTLNLVIFGFMYLLVGSTWAGINLSSTAAIASLAQKGQEGTAIGLYNTIIGLATIVGSVVGGFLAKTVGYGVCFGLGAILASLVAAGLWWLRTMMPAQKEGRAGDEAA